MEPAIVDEIFHFPVAGLFEADFTACGKPVVRIVLIVFIAISVFSDALTVKSLIFEFLSDIPE